MRPVQIPCRFFRQVIDSAYLCRTCIDDSKILCCLFIIIYDIIVIPRGKLTYIASESGEAVDGHTGRNGPGQFRVRSGQAEDFAFNARGRGPRRRRESGRSANCGHGRAGQAPLVENPETQCGPPAAGDIVGFPGDDQNQSAKCTPSGEQTTSRPNSSGCGKEPRGESCLSRFRPRDAA